MKLNACAVKEYQCVYSNVSAFNSLADEVYNLLADYDVYVWIANENTNYCDWEIHCDTDAFEKCIEELKELPPEKTCAYFSEDPENAGITNYYVVEVFKEWLKCKDEKDKVIRIHWL